MTVFVDTSALYGALDDTDPHHARLTDALRSLVGEKLVTHNYVVVESATLVGRRLGDGPTRKLLDDLLVLAEIVWVDESIHQAAVSTWLTSGRRGPSLVDYTSFEVMRRLGIRRAFAVDRDFADAGFDVIPA